MALSAMSSARNNLDLHLGQKIHDIFRAPDRARCVPSADQSPLASVNRNALQPDILQRLLHLVEFEGLYDRLDLFSSCLRLPGPPAQQLPAEPR